MAKLSDDDVLKAIREGHTTLRAICTYLDTDDSRVVDRVLQRLRRASRITFHNTWGWQIVAARKSAIDDVLDSVSKALHGIDPSEHVSMLDELRRRVDDMLVNARKAERRHEAATRYVKRGA